MKYEWEHVNRYGQTVRCVVTDGKGEPVSNDVDDWEVYGFADVDDPQAVLILRLVKVLREGQSWLEWHRPAEESNAELRLRQELLALFGEPLNLAERIEELETEVRRLTHELKVERLHREAAERQRDDHAEEIRLLFEAQRKLQ